MMREDGRGEWECVETKVKHHDSISFSLFFPSSLCSIVREKIRERIDKFESARLKNESCSCLRAESSHLRLLPRPFVPLFTFPFLLLLLFFLPSFQTFLPSFYSYPPPPPCCWLLQETARPYTYPCAHTSTRIYF